MLHTTAPLQQSRSEPQNVCFRTGVHFTPFGRQIGIVNAVQARRVDRPIVAIVAGSAPTAHLIGELETKGLQPVHVYGLT